MTDSPQSSAAEPRLITLGCRLNTYESEARRMRPDIAFGADLIAGFPTETEAMFQQSIDRIDACDLAYLHVSPFSPRHGTPAARVSQVARPVVKERAARLRGKGAEALVRHLTHHVGRMEDVLMERNGTGRTLDFSEIEVPGAAFGNLVRSRVIGVAGMRLIGEVLA